MRTISLEGQPRLLIRKTVWVSIRPNDSDHTSTEAGGTEHCVKPRVYAPLDLRTTFPQQKQRRLELLLKVERDTECSQSPNFPHLQIGTKTPL